MSEPLVVEFDVGAPPVHAFDVWTRRAGMWWPPGHTVSGRAPADVVFEPFAGGRVFERGPDGTEHDWGEVVAWQPPHRVAYLWHLFFAPESATEVEVTFTPAEVGTTVRIVQTGWERLGDAAETRRRNTHAAWWAIVSLYQAAAGG